MIFPKRESNPAVLEKLVERIKVTNSENAQVPSNEYPMRLDPGTCAFCGEPVDKLAGDPGMWSLMFCHPDGTGYARDHHVKCVQSRLFPPAHETSEQRETGWLIEDGGHTPRYRTMVDGNFVWTYNANEAIRFARRVDAEMVSREDEDAWRIAEHQWITLDGDQLHTQKALEPRCECGISEVWPEQFNPNCPRHKGIKSAGSEGEQHGR